ncbi:MAG: AraC family transcriptional regulator [Luteibacter sp.]
MNDRHLPTWARDRLQRFIETHLDRRLAIAELASAIGYSQSYFFRAFKASFGMTPHAYVLDRRLERACRLMLATDDALSDIAVRCGLADQAHFTRRFRRAFDAPPGAWRRRERALSPVIYSP